MSLFRYCSVPLFLYPSGCTLRLVIFSHPRRIINRKMGRTCCYPGCISGLAAANKLGLKKYTFFSIPKNPQRRQQWQKALNRSRPFIDSEVICEKHFIDKDILRQDKLLLCDGSTFTSNRQKIRLSSTAIPHNSKANTEVTATPCNTYHVEFIKAEPLPIVNDTDTESRTAGATNFNPCTVDKQCKWDILKEITNITLPGKWAYMICGNNVIIGIWKLDGSSVKRLVLQPDSVVQVFINNEVVNVPGITAVNSLEDLLRNIKILEPLVLCNGKVAGQLYSKQCVGFIDSSKTKLRYGNYWCVHCRTIRRKNCLKEKRQKTLLQKCQRKQKIVKIERQRRKRMQSRIEKLKNYVRNVLLRKKTC